MSKNEFVYDLDLLKERHDLELLSKIHKRCLEGCFEELCKKESEVVDDFIRESLKNCIPSIKGEITKGKIRWRGLNLGIRYDWNIGENGVEYWLLQRGKKISPTLKISRDFDQPNSKITTKYECVYEK